MCPLIVIVIIVIIVLICGVLVPLAANAISNIGRDDQASVNSLSEYIQEFRYLLNINLSDVNIKPYLKPSIS